MSTGDATSLLVIALAAVLAPLLSELLRRWRIPSVLFELFLGILIGPAVLGWAEIDGFVAGLAQLGVAFLFFMAGYEIEFARLRGTPLNRALASWGVTVALALLVGVVLMIEGFVISSLLVGLALTSTAIGTLLPMLRDRGLLGTRFGDAMSAAGAVGEFGPIVAVTVLLGSDSPVHEFALLGGFVLVAVVVAIMASRRQPPKLVALLQRHLTTSTQLPVRVAVLLIVGMLALATQLGLDMLLGAFAAGMIARLALHNEEAQATALVPRLESLGFGFLIPTFFIVSGMKFDVTALGDPAVLLRTAVFFVLFLVVRGAPALVVYRGVLGGRERTALAILQATALPIVVVITEIGLETERMLPENATALVAAGMLSVLVFPLTAFKVLEGGRSDTEAAASAPPDRTTAG